MYRGGNTRPPVACTRCRATIAQDDSVLDTEGRTLCLRCGMVRDALDRVERARRAVLAGGDSEPSAAEVRHANEQAARQVREIEALACAPRPEPLAVTSCRACTAPSATAVMQYTEDGALLCPSCFGQSQIVRGAATAAQERQRDRLLRGAVLAFAVLLALVMIAANR